MNRKKSYESVKEKRIILKSTFPMKFPLLPIGKWSALSQAGVLVGVGDTVKEALERAKLRGEDNPILTGDMSVPRA